LFPATKSSLCAFLRYVANPDDLGVSCRVF
jgi:hypothetical protein